MESLKDEPHLWLHQLGKGSEISRLLRDSFGDVQPYRYTHLSTLRYSWRKALTGLFIAAFIDWKLIVSHATTKASKPERAYTARPTSTLY